MARPKKVVKPRRRRRGTGSISVAADGTIRARLPSRIDPKRPAREFPPGHLAEAIAWLDDAIGPRPSGVPADITLETWVGQWWETYVEPVRPPNTARWAVYALQQLAPVYDVPIAEIRPSALQAVVGTLTRRVGPATVANMVGVWRRCFDAAVEDELLARNPARRLVLPKPSPRPTQRHATSQEVAALWPEIVGHRFEAAYALMLGCGLRIGEILGLHWRDVDLAGRRAWIGPQFTNGRWRPLPKGRNPHHIRLPSRVIASLIRHRNNQPPGTVLVMQSAWQDHGRARRKRPPDEDGPRPWSAHSVTRDLAELCRRAGVDPLTAHVGRRGLASALIDAGASPAIVADHLGHHDPSITMRSYVKASDEGRARAAEIVDAYLGDGSSEGVSGADTVC